MYSSKDSQWRREQTKIQDAATSPPRIQHILFPYLSVSLLLLSARQQSHFVQSQHKISFLQFNNRLNFPFPPFLYPPYRPLYQQSVVPSATPSASNPAIYQPDGSITQPLCHFSRTQLPLLYQLPHSFVHNFITNHFCSVSPSLKPICTTVSQVVRRCVFIAGSRVQLLAICPETCGTASDFL